MKKNKCSLLILALSCCLLAVVFAPNSALSDTKPKKKIPDFFTLKKGKVIRRPGTTTRGPGGKEYPNISALAPYERGYTTQKSPTLYWFLSGPWKGRVIFTINNFESMETLLEIDVPHDGAGIYPVSLKNYQIRLETGVEYEWYISLVPDEKNRSADIVSSASIVRTPLSESLSQQLKEEKEKDFLLYAREGIWYDTISDLSEMISKEKENRELRGFRADFLDQVQLTYVAKFDRKE